MKRTAYILMASLAALAMVTTSCDALWGSSIDTGTGYYGAGIDNEWYPSLPGAPLLSPVYWGGNIYPGSSLPPLPPSRPGSGYVPPANQPTGATRPGVTVTPSTPVTPPASTGSSVGRPGNSIVPPEGTFTPEQVTGGQPGVVMPPAGSGMQRSRH